MEVAGCFFHFSSAWLGFFLLLDNHRPGEQTAEIKSAKVIALISHSIIISKLLRATKALLNSPW